MNAQSIRFAVYWLPQLVSDLEATFGMIVPKAAVSPCRIGSSARPAIPIFATFRPITSRRVRGGTEAAPPNGGKRGPRTALNRCANRKSSRRAARHRHGRRRSASRSSRGWSPSAGTYAARRGETLRLRTSEPHRARWGREGKAPPSRAEPPRLCRRLHDLRGWSHGTTERVLTGGAGAGGAAGVGAAGRARLAMGGDRIDRGEDRVYGRDAAEVGAAA